jgi:glycosyltransferase involved in cell wall biosynthesis
MVKVSVVIPAYRSVQFIERCLRSLESQTLASGAYEVIVVIDGPDELMSKIINEKFPEFLTITHKTNLGLPSALNAGLLKAVGRYVVRVDSDDYVDSRYLDYLLYTIESNPDYGAVACDYIEVDRKERHIKHFNSSNNPIGCGIIFSRQALLDIGLYDTNFLLREEEELMIRFLGAGNNKLHLPLPLYRYRKHSENITRNVKSMSFYKDKLLS